MIEVVDSSHKEALLQKLSNPAAPLSDLLGSDLCVELFRAHDPVVHA